VLKALLNPNQPLNNRADIAGVTVDETD